VHVPQRLKRLSCETRSASSIRLYASTSESKTIELLYRYWRNVKTVSAQSVGNLSVYQIVGISTPVHSKRLEKKSGGHLRLANWAIPETVVHSEGALVHKERATCLDDDAVCKDDAVLCEDVQICKAVRLHETFDVSLVRGWQHGHVDQLGGQLVVWCAQDLCQRDIER